MKDLRDFSLTALQFRVSRDNLSSELRTAQSAVAVAVDLLFVAIGRSIFETRTVCSGQASERPSHRKK